MSKQKEKIKNWEERFDKMAEDCFYGFTQDGEYNLYLSDLEEMPKLKQFISSLLEEEKQKSYQEAMLDFTKRYKKEALKQWKEEVIGEIEKYNVVDPWKTKDDILSILRK
jgi:hypothetical protein